MVADSPDGPPFDASEGVDFAVGGRPEPDDPRSGPRQPPKSEPPALPEGLPVLVPASGPFGIATAGQEEPTPSVRRLAAAARAYAAAKGSANTARAYASDWKLFCRWCRRQGFGSDAPDPQVGGLYLAALAAGDGVDPCAVSTIERKLSAIGAAYRAEGQRLDRQDRHIANVMAGIRRSHGRPPRPPTPPRRGRRRPCWARTFSPWWRPSPTTCVAGATAPSCSSALPAACVAPRSPASTAARVRRRA